MYTEFAMLIFLIIIQIMLIILFSYTAYRVGKKLENKLNKISIACVIISGILLLAIPVQIFTLRHTIRMPFFDYKYCADCNRYNKTEEALTKDDFISYDEMPSFSYMLQERCSVCGSLNIWESKKDYEMYQKEGEIRKANREERIRAKKEKNTITFIPGVGIQDENELRKFDDAVEVD